jgi:hypothetical protein
MPRLTYAARSGAGSTATRRFKRGMRSWRTVIVNRTRWAFILVGGIPIAIEIGRANHHALDWALGLTTGGAMALWLVLADSPPWYIEKWRWGAEAERWTARELGTLRRRGWRLLHDIPATRGNRDHVVFGPGGAYLLDTKRFVGRDTIDGDVIHVERTHDAYDQMEWTNVSKRVRGLAVELKRELDGGGVHVGWVRAVVVIWSDFPQQLVEGDRITFVHGERLVRWLTQQQANRQFEPGRAELVLTSREAT